MSRLDTARLLSRMHIGSVPPSAAAVLDAGFDTLVLCAVEIQPPDDALLGLQVIRCPLVDDYTKPLSPADWKRAVDTARDVTRALRGGSRVLVTCAAGRNRSGLICGLVLHLGTGRSGRESVPYIQRRRANALSNPQFVTALSRL